VFFELRCGTEIMPASPKWPVARRSSFSTRNGTGKTAFFRQGRPRPMQKTKTKDTIKYLFPPILLVAILLGCSAFDHQFRIRFESIDGLVKADPVFFEDTAIGRVDDIEYTDAGHFLVEVSIEDQFSSWPKTSSTFYIGSNPNAESRKAVRITPGADSGEKIAKNAVVRGESKYVALYQKMITDFLGGANGVNAEIARLLQKIQEFPTDEQIEQLERQLDRILSEIENMGAGMKQKLKQEILPLLQEKIEQLRRLLEKNGKEEKLDRVEEKMQKLSEQVKV
jgi:paraquat-inducible protein B